MQRFILFAAVLALALPFSGSASHTNTQYVSGPFGSVMLEEGGAFGYGRCQEIDPGLPAACDSAPGTYPAPNSAWFDTSSWNADAAAASSWGRLLYVQVNFRDGTWLNGFATALGSDVNDNGFAENLANSPDEMFWGSSTSYSSGLGFAACVAKDQPTLLDPNNDEYDDFVVTIFNWVDEANVDYGLSTGTFSIQVIYYNYVDEASCRNPDVDAPPMVH